MKWLFVAVTVLALSMMVAGPALAADMCSAPTIPALAECVTHHVSNAGVAHSLQAKLSAAEASLNRGNSATAINLLNAFVNEVQAQSGVFIPAEHAAHMVMHAESVIAALAG